MAETYPLEPRLTVAMLGARRRYAVPRIFAQEGWLELFYTDLYAAAPWLTRLRSSPPPHEALRKALGRSAADIPADRVRQFPLFGLSRIAAARAATNPSARLRSYRKWNHAFCRRVVRGGLGPANGVYVFNTAGLEIARTAREQGLKIFVDQITAPWQVEESILKEERQRWPNWESGATSEGDWRPLADREAQEWALADCILCGSAFVQEGIGKVAGPVEKCRVVPYGNASGSLAHAIRKPQAGPLRVLFVGTIQLRKGIQYLAEAARSLPANTAEFRAVGPIRVAREAARGIAAHIELRGALSRDSLLREYQWADVLALPSLSEGSANVCYEALAAGLPVIATPNSGSVIRDGEEGFIVPIRESGAIRDRLQRLADDRDLLNRLAENARSRAGEFSHEAYGRRLTGVISEAYNP